MPENDQPTDPYSVNVARIAEIELQLAAANSCETKVRKCVFSFRIAQQ